MSYSFSRCRYSKSLKARLIIIATTVASTMPCTEKAPKESFAPERPIIIITEVITRLEDLLAFIDDVHANDDHKDKTIGKTFTLKFFTKRWQYIEHYKITRTEKGWDIKVLGDSYSSNKSISPELNHLLDNDGV